MIAALASPAPATIAMFRQGENGYSRGLDTFVRRDYSRQEYNYGGGVDLSIQSSGGPVPVRQALVNFQDVFGIGPGQVAAGKKLTGATLRMKLRTDLIPGSAAKTLFVSPTLIEIPNYGSSYRLASHGEVTWKQREHLRAGWGIAGTELVNGPVIEEDYDSNRTVSQSYYNSDLGTFIDIDVTDIVMECYNGTLSNLGFTIRPDSGGYAAGSFHSNEFETVADRPQLEVSYLDPVASVARPGFGKQWVRRNPFTLGALTQTPTLVDGPTYRGAGLNTFLAWKRPDELLPIAVGEGLPWQFHVSEASLTADVINEISESITNFAGNNGWLVNDEPSFLQMAGTADIVNYLKHNSPKALVYTNAFPIGGDSATYYGNNSNPGYKYSDYLNDIMTRVQPDVLMFDLYPFNAAKVHADLYYNNLLTICHVAQTYDVPYWAFIQAYEKIDAPNLRRLSSESDLRFQMFTMLTAGFKGFHYFGYDLGGWRALIDSSDGSTTSLYDAAAPANAEVQMLGAALRFLESTDVRYIPNSGQTPQGGMPSWSFGAGDDLLITDVDIDGAPVEKWKDGVIGFFTDDDGEKYFMITNAFHGADMSAADALLDFRIEFDPGVTEVLSLNRITGEQEVLPLGADNILRLALPGGTGMLFKYNTGKGFQLNVADFTSDGVVDGADLVDWQRGYGFNGDSDANGDGISGGADFLIWQRNLTDVSPLSQHATVPEPSLLLFVGWLGLAISDNRRKLTI
ncbi:DNRLRE domain-containing protein [Adhaeretor mobilis]|nr:DNRLRE domain-containing protein [Adhaeretor mobilis]